MADCGAGGSALDRTVRAALGGHNNEAGKVWAPLLGHAGMVGTTQSVRPESAPTTLVMPDHTVAPSVSPHGSPSAAVAAAVVPITLHQHPQHYHYPSQAAASRIQSHPTMMNQHHHMLQQMHHQQQMMMMMNAQMQQQQQQQYQRQQQQQRQAQTTKTTFQTDETKTPDTVPVEDTVDYDPKLDTYGHEDVHTNNNIGAGMEELEAAWAEAEAAYEAEFGHRDLDDNDPLAVDDAVNLAAAFGTTTHDEDQHATYEFQSTDASTPPDNIDPQHWMDEGMRHFAAGNVRQAIYCFETQLQHCHDENNAQAWRMLGKCHAENDQDREAIQCLNQAVERDPYATDALLALAVSHVNELNHEKALACCKAWITHNPQYAGMELTDDLYGEATAEVDGGGGTNREKNVFDDVQRLLLLALEHDPNNASAILQTLGVIYNVNRDYDAAVSAFRRALDASPDDYELWNKLGATLANGNQSEKALPAYQRALESRPRYARAWLNMAISYSNLQNYEEAARCYLQTLSLNPAAMHCWSYLRIALSCSEKWDLIPLAASRDLAAFREHYDFVLYANDAPVAGGGT